VCAPPQPPLTPPPRAPPAAPPPPPVLQVAARHVQSEGVMGSSTVCLATINLAVGRLQVATLGDSGIFVIGKRPGGGRLNGGRLEVKFRTPQQEHEFGRPYQLGHFQHANVPEVGSLSRRGPVLGGGAGGGTMAVPGGPDGRPPLWPLPARCRLQRAGPLAAPPPCARQQRGAAPPRPTPRRPASTRRGRAGR
jgi:hypothetical protein